MSLEVKRKILILILVTLLGGNVIRLSSAVPGDQSFALEAPVYADAELTASFMYPPKHNFNYDDSTLITINARIQDIDLNPEHIRKIEEYLSSRGAPLAAEAYYFEKMAVKYNLPYNLMPAISVLESSGGLYNYRPYNYAGMGGQSGALTFESYAQAIEKHAQILRYGYFDAGADTPAEIAPYYCPPCTTWDVKVQSIMNAIEAE